MTLGSGLLVAATAALPAVALQRSNARAESGAKHVATASAIPPGGSVLFRYPSEYDPCILVRSKDGQLTAYSQVCTHLSCAVVHRPEKDMLFCPCHNGAFSASDGRPAGGPPTRRLPRIVLEQRGDEVWAVGKEA